MNPSHLYSCPACGAPQTVELRQAGQSVRCQQCQQDFDAPKLRELKLLPVANAASSPASSRDRGSTTGILFSLGLGLLLLAGSSGAALYWYGNSMLPKFPPEQVIVEQQKLMETNPLTQVYFDWETLYKERLMPEWQESQMQSEIKQGGYLKTISYVLLSIAGAGLLCVIVSLVRGSARRR